MLIEARAGFVTTDYGTDKYGVPWTFHDWLGFKGGLIEEQVFRMLNNFEKTLAAGDREIIAAERQRMADEKRAAAADKRRQRAEAQAQRRQAEAEWRAMREGDRQAKAILKEMENEAEKARRRKRAGRTQGRKNRVAELNNPALNEAFHSGKLSPDGADRIIAVAENITDDPEKVQTIVSDLVRQHLAHLGDQIAPARKARGRKNTAAAPRDKTTLALAAEAKQAADAALVALELDPVTARRERIRAYGAALLALRERLDDKAFAALIRMKGLEIGDTAAREDAMWLAASWDTLPLEGCPHAHPGAVRRWVNERLRDGVIPFPIRSAT
ncbi:MAG: hypothetical protein J2P48_06915 [Alphaproteobacteria bacterium]|nr:hypothetical protein [Alphaproteobacteria bacterium]